MRKKWTERLQNVRTKTPVDKSVTGKLYPQNLNNMAAYKTHMMTSIDMPTRMGGNLVRFQP